MPDTDQGGETNIESGGDTTIGGDVVGRDKITTTTTSTTNVGQDSVAGDKVTQTTTTSTTNVEGGPTTRTAIIGVIIIAALAIIILAAIIFDGNAPARPSPTPTAPAPSVTPVLPTSTFVIAVFTETPVPATTEPPSPIPAITSAPSSTPTTETPTPTDTAFPTNTPTLTLTPSPTSALGIYDDFNDQCLDDARWDFSVLPVAEATPTPTPIPSRGGCLDTQRDFLTEDRDGHLNVFLTLEGDVSDSLIQKSNACYKEAEVLLALHDVIIFDENVRSAYLSVGLSVARKSGPSFVELRLEGTNASGRFQPQITTRLTLLGAGGPTTLAVLPYTFDQLVRVAFRVNDTYGLRLTAYVNDQPIKPDLSIESAPCGLTLGYHADDQTLLDGYFDEARLEPLP